jgi:hypothetical protein
MTSHISPWYATARYVQSACPSQRLNGFIGLFACAEPHLRACLDADSHLSKPISASQEQVFDFVKKLRVLKRLDAEVCSNERIGSWYPTKQLPPKADTLDWRTRAAWWPPGRPSAIGRPPRRALGDRRTTRPCLIKPPSSTRRWPKGWAQPNANACPRSGEHNREGLDHD